MGGGNNAKTGKGAKSLIRKDGRILVLLKPNGKSDLPGGRVKDGEGSQETLHREISEETGLKVKILAQAVEWSFCKNQFLQITGVTFYCQYLGRNVSLSDEHSDYSWVGIDEIGQMDWQRPYFGTLKTSACPSRPNLEQGVLYEKL
jgi:8-oxo-dGTP pyrophosphatase MutT (NUDIX family)